MYSFQEWWTLREEGKGRVVYYLREGFRFQEDTLSFIWKGEKGSLLRRDNAHRADKRGEGRKSGLELRERGQSISHLWENRSPFHRKRKGGKGSDKKKRLRRPGEHSCPRKRGRNPAHPQDRRRRGKGVFRRNCPGVADGRD